MSKEIILSKIDNLPVRLSGTWIKRKHHFLQEYARILTVGMGKKWQGRLTFLDLFAGPGSCMIEKTNEELAGSPLLAFQHEFGCYIFVEESPVLMNTLKTRCKNFPKFASTKFIQADCNQCIDQIIKQMPKDYLNFAFIDPTDIDIHYETIKALSKNPTGVDLLMNIQYGMDFKRNYGNYMKQGADSKLARFLGKDFDRSLLKKPKDVIEIYKLRLEELGYGTVKFREIAVANSKNAQMYFLLFASKHPRGLYYWEQISKKDEQGQGELF